MDFNGFHRRSGRSVVRRFAERKTKKQRKREKQKTKRNRHTNRKKEKEKQKRKKKQATKRNKLAFFLCCSFFFLFCFLRCLFLCCCCLFLFALAWKGSDGPWPGKVPIYMVFAFGGPDLGWADLRWPQLSPILDGHHQGQPRSSPLKEIP